MEKIEFTESQRHPLCPHCEKELTEIHWHKIKGSGVSLGYLVVHSCPHCRKVISATSIGN